MNFMTKSYLCFIKPVAFQQNYFSKSKSKVRYRYIIHFRKHLDTFCCASAGGTNLCFQGLQLSHPRLNYRRLQGGLKQQTQTKWANKKCKNDYIGLHNTAVIPLALVHLYQVAFFDGCYVSQVFQKRKHS